MNKKYGFGKNQQHDNDSDEDTEKDSEETFTKELSFEGEGFIMNKELQEAKKYAVGKLKARDKFK